MNEDTTVSEREDAKPKIFVFVNTRRRDGDVIGVALAEDGDGLASHGSSSVGFLHHDMGLSGTWKHEKYAAHYPDGYELVNLLDLSEAELDAHAGLAAAVARANEKAKRPATDSTPSPSQSVVTDV